MVDMEMCFIIIQYFLINKELVQMFLKALTISAETLGEINYSICEMLLCKVKYPYPLYHYHDDAEQVPYTRAARHVTGMQVIAAVPKPKSYVVLEVMSGT